MIYDNDPYSQTNYFEEKMNYTENYAMSFLTVENRLSKAEELLNAYQHVTTSL